MEKIKIFVVAPYEGMKTIVDEIEEERADIRLYFALGNLSTLDFIVEKIEEIKPDIIIARGLTADWLTRNVRIPVVKITLSGYDILSAIRMAQSTNRKFAIVGFESMTSGAEVMCSLLHYRTEIIEAHEETDIQQAVISLKSQGYELIVGGTLAVQMAEKIGLGGIHITSGKESIQAAITHAVGIYLAYEKKLTEIKMLKNVVINSGYHTVVFDEKEDVIFRSESNDALFTAAKGLCRRICGENDKICLKKDIDGKTFFFCGCSFRVDNKRNMAFYMKEQPAANSGGDGIKIFNMSDVKYYLPDIVYGKSKYMADAVSDAQLAAKKGCNVIIEGEAGVEADEFAKYIFKNSEAPHDFFISLDFEKLSCEELKYMDDCLPPAAFVNGVTIFMKNTEYMTMVLGRELSKLCSGKQYRYIISLETRNVSGGQGFFLQDIINSEDTTIISLLPIYQRADDIINLIILFITACNLKYGKNVIGLEDDATEFVKSYRWKRNYMELKLVIARAVKRTNSFYLSGECIKHEVEKYEALVADSKNKNIVLSGTLADITKNVINVVLEEEDNNRTRTAERLHISRSKLWNILK